MKTNIFDLESEALVSQPFTFNGRDYKAGEVFPHRDPKLIAVGLDQGTVKGLWKVEKIRFTGRPYGAQRGNSKPQNASAQ